MQWGGKVRAGRAADQPAPPRAYNRRAMTTTSNPDKHEAAYVFAAELEQIPGDDALVVTVAGRELALFRLDDEVYALENFCPHRGGPIGEGLVRDGQVTCPWHEWSFDIRTGLCTLNPAAAVRTFPTKVVDRAVLVLLEPTEV